MRRVQRRMHVNQLPTLAAYVEFLKQNSQEAGALLRIVAGTGHSATAERPRRDGNHTPVGARLRHGRRGLLPGDPAARTPGHPADGAPRAGFRHRHRRPRPGRGAGGAISRRLA
ncbi:hypothetical protein G6F65_020526 [Rhizopus arrhizus]|nr:hypothetical protein G6F65_020526 [Rhizopus arrhizus]